MMILFKLANERPKRFKGERKRYTNEIEVIVIVKGSVLTWWNAGNGGICGFIE